MICIGGSADGERIPNGHQRWTTRYADPSYSASFASSSTFSTTSTFTDVTYYLARIPVMIPYGTTVEEAQERLHEPSISRKNGLLFLNPGSAGPRRFNLPINLALLRVMGGKVEAQLVELRV